MGYVLSPYRAQRKSEQYCRYAEPDPQLYRPAEVNLLAHRIGFEELVNETVDKDCHAVGIERAKE